MSSIHDRISQARQKKGLSMEKLAERVGLRSWQAVQQWENGTTAPKRKRLEMVADALDVTVDHLLTGSAAADEAGDHAPIRLVDAAASAGRGEVVFSEDTKKELMFGRDWLKRRGAKPESSLAFPVKGDSMVDDCIPDGSIVLVNTGKTDPLPGKVYVLWLNGELFVKQLAQDGGLWFARSRNKAKAKKYPDIQIDPDGRLVGQVFWCGFDV